METSFKIFIVDFYKDFIINNIDPVPTAYWLQVYTKEMWFV